MAQEKKSFMLYLDYRQHLALLSDEDRGRLLMALFDYAETKTAPELSGAAGMAFSFIKAQMDRDDAKYEETVEKRRSAGRQGGRPPKQTETPESTENQEKAKKANGFSEKQTKAKKPDTDTVTDTDIHKPPTPLSGGAPPAEEAPVPFAKIMELYNGICSSFPKIKVIDGQRRKAVAARWRTYKSLEVFERLFRLTEASDFMKGMNEKNWSADFDWIMKPTNMAKTLEGKYDNDRMKGGGRGGFNSEHPERGSAEKQQAPEAGAPKLSGFQIVGTDGDG